MAFSICIGQLYYVILIIFLYVFSPLVYRIKVGTCSTSGEGVGSVQWSRSSNRTITNGTGTFPDIRPSDFNVFEVDLHYLSSHKMFF